MRTYVIVLIVIVIVSGVSGLYAAFSNFGYIALLMGIVIGSTITVLKTELNTKTER